MCGQSVHERLSKMGVIKSPEFTEIEKKHIKQNYEKYSHSGRLKELSSKMGRGKTSICRVARAMGLTNQRGKKDWTKIHGMSRHFLYPTWQAMIARCYNPKHGGYKWYGERGISVCEEWIKVPSKFIIWAINNGYTGNSKLQLDRINNDGDYTPSNCHFVTPKEQARNRRSNIRTEFNGFQKTIAEIAEITSLNRHTIRRRYHKGDRNEILIRPLQR